MNVRRDATARHRVVVVGGGFGGLPAARHLGHKPVDVTLVDRRNHHLFQPLLYQVATGMLSSGQVAQPLRHIVRRTKNVRVELAEVTGFDLERRVVHATGPAQLHAIEIPYDSLIVSGGATQSYFGHDELARYTPGMKTIDDARELRRRIFGAFEMAELEPTRRRSGSGSPSSSSAPAPPASSWPVRCELAVRCLKGEFQTFDPASMRVLLLDGGKEPLATFGHHLSGKAAKSLERLGVELHMGTRVTGVDVLGVDADNHDGTTTRIDAYTTIWAAGVQASPLAAMLAEACSATVDRAGRIEVLPDLTIPGHPEVFAIGDMAALDDLPGVAEVAMQGGLHASNTILRRLRGQDDGPVQVRDVGSVATIGRFRASPACEGSTSAVSPAGSSGSSSTSPSSMGSGAASRRCCDGSARWSAAAAPNESSAPRTPEAI